jgi:hypothetical protein
MEGRTVLNGAGGGQCMKPDPDTYIGDMNAEPFDFSREPASMQ